jgi:hypothetical protein
MDDYDGIWIGVVVMLIIWFVLCPVANLIWGP